MVKTRKKEKSTEIPTSKKPSRPILGKNTLKKLLKSEGAKNVSSKAVEALSKVFTEIAAETVILSKHAKRKTVLRSDVEATQALKKKRKN